MIKAKDISFLDKGIEKAVQIFIDNGFKTFESCEGGQGHCFSDPTIRFEGDQYDCIRAIQVAKKNNLNVLECKMVFREVDDVLERPFCEITFLIHKATESIYLPS